MKINAITNLNYSNLNSRTFSKDSLRKNDSRLTGNIIFKGIQGIKGAALGSGVGLGLLCLASLCLALYFASTAAFSFLFGSTGAWTGHNIIISCRSLPLMD